MDGEGDDIKELRIESEIKDLLLELQSRLNHSEVVGIVYNPKKEEGMKRQDGDFLKFLFDKNKYSYPLFILSGHGGDFIPGVEFPRIIKSHVKNYRVFIPRFCGSALCYTILKSEELIIGKNTSITQIDPTFEYNGLTYRAIKVIKDSLIKDNTLKDTAREVFRLAEKHIKELCEPPSIFKYKNIDYAEFQHFDYLAATFMNKEDHEKHITYNELNTLEANFKRIENEEIDNLSNKFIMKCQDFTIRKNVRVAFVSSIPIRLENEQEGVFICPIY